MSQGSKLMSGKVYRNLAQKELRRVKGGAGRREELNIPPCNSASYCIGVGPHFPNSSRTYKNINSKNIF